jgi:hypothetical protein
MAYTKVVRTRISIVGARGAAAKPHVRACSFRTYGDSTLSGAMSRIDVATRFVRQAASNRGNATRIAAIAIGAIAIVASLSRTYHPVAAHSHVDLESIVTSPSRNVHIAGPVYGDSSRPKMDIPLAIPARVHDLGDPAIRSDPEEVVASVTGYEHVAGAVHRDITWTNQAMTHAIAAIINDRGDMPCGSDLKSAVDVARPRKIDVSTGINSDAFSAI